MFRKAHLIGSIALATMMLFSAGVAKSEIRLAPGDVLVFSVLGFPSLDRQVVIDIDGAVYLPFAGKVAASNLTMDELRSKVYNSLRDRAYRVVGANGEDVWRRLHEDDLYLDVVQYRPVYVTGDVREPGDVEYRPGMSVRQALAMAGGVGMPIEQETEGEALNLLLQRSLLIGRIEAQQTFIQQYNADLESMAATDDNLEDPSLGLEHNQAIEQNPTELASVSQRWLEARSDLRGLRETGNSLVLDRMSNRLEVLEELEAASGQFLSFEEEEFERTLELAERGVIPTSAVAEARSGLLQASTRALETSGEVLRLRLDLTRFAEDAKADITSERVNLLEAISNSTAQLRDLERQLSGVETRLTALGSATSADEQDISVKIEMFRKGSEETTRVANVTPATAVMPGDVIEITLELSALEPVSQ